MKKIISLLLMLVFILSLCSCSQKNDIEANKTYIQSVDALPEEYKAFNVFSDFVTDINSDGKDDIIALFTDAEKTEVGFNKNDGNNWSLVISDGSGTAFYELFKDYVQLGEVYFQVADYFRDGKPIPTITFYESSGAALKIMNFTFEEGKGFLKEEIYNSSKRSDSGINLKYSSIPVY